MQNFKIFKNFIAHSLNFLKSPNHALLGNPTKQQKEKKKRKKKINK
jgi:hypothetical protein